VTELELNSPKRNNHDREVHHKHRVVDRMSEVAQWQQAIPVKQFLDPRKPKGSL
jgi:hypothetical protein